MQRPAPPALVDARAPIATRYVVGLAILGTVLLLVASGSRSTISPERLVDLLGLSSEHMSWRRLHTVLTCHLLPRDPRATFFIALTLFVLYAFGADLEQRFGTRDTFIFYGGAAVVSAGAFLLVAGRDESIFFGHDAIAYATFFALGVTKPWSRVLLGLFVPVPIWLAIVLFAIFDLATLAIPELSRSPELAARLAACVFGMLFALAPIGLDRWRAHRRRREWQKRLS